MCRDLAALVAQQILSALETHADHPQAPAERLLHVIHTVAVMFRNSDEYQRQMLRAIFETVLEELSKPFKCAGTSLPLWPKLNRCSPEIDASHP